LAEARAGGHGHAPVLGHVPADAAGADPLVLGGDGGEALLGLRAVLHAVGEGLHAVAAAPVGGLALALTLPAALLLGGGGGGGGLVDDGRLGVLARRGRRLVRGQGVEGVGGEVLLGDLCARGVGVRAGGQREGQCGEERDGRAGGGRVHGGVYQGGWDGGEDRHSASVAGGA